MNSLQRLSASTLAALALAFAASMPASAELLYVTLDNSTVTSYDISQSTASAVQNSAQTFLSLGFVGVGLAFDSASNVYVADLGANLVRKYSFSGTPLSTIATNTPLGLAIDANDNLYVANHNFNTVTKFDSSGASVSSISSAVAQDVAFDSSGNIYISNGSPSDTVSKYNSSGSLLSTISGNMNNPYGLALDTSANLFVANLNTNVSEFNSAGVFQTALSPSSGDARANDTFVDSLGNLYVSNYYGNTISKFDSSGNYVFGWSTPSNPRFMAVPEPSTYAMALAGLACGGYLVRRRRSRNPHAMLAATSLALAGVCLYTTIAHAVTIDWVTVGDPGNTADTTTYGAVADSFQIMKFEFTNAQYTDFLNAVDPSGTNPNSVYNTDMGSNARGGISFTSGAASGSKYAVKTNMGDKPVNFVSWFDAARVANWLENGQGSGSTETGAYTLSGATSGTAPAANPGASYFLPTEDQWYKAAYYKGGSTNAGYWDYATQSDADPTAVTADGVGNGSAAGTGNFANYNLAADWNSQDGNVTTVGTNGGVSAYDTFDMSGNVTEWNDLTGAAGSSRGIRGGAWGSTLASDLSPSVRDTIDPSLEGTALGFRLAAVPEPSTYAMALAGLACGGYLVRRRRKRNAG